jgi:PPP family 3-phenylpropionic acid transporter
MIMGLPLFLLFAVYGTVNAYLPILLDSLGYSATSIGLLQGAFEASGLIFPVFISSRVDRKGNYGIVMILLGLVMVIVLPPLVLVPKFWVTALSLAVLAIGFKGSVPVADALVSRRLGENRNDYGRIRVLGSIGFVCITLMFQFTHAVDPSSPASIALWIAIPSVLFSLSVACVPGLRRRYVHQDQPTRETDTLETVAQQRETVEVPDVAAVAAVRPNALARGLAKLCEFPRSFWIGIILMFLGFFGLTPSQRFFSLYVQEYLGLDSYTGLWALSVMAEVPFMFLSGWFIKKFGTKKIIIVSLITITARNLVYASFPTFAGAISGQLFHSVCFGLFHPAAIVYVSERAPKRLLALGMTLYSSVAVGIASVLGNISGGIIIDRLGYRPLFVIFSVFPLIGVALFAATRKQSVSTVH